MFYVVGLGNPGEKYQTTRHNVGWMVLDYMIENLGLPQPVASSKYAGRISEGVIAGTEVSLLYPDTYMNKSGSAVKKLVPKQAEQSLIVVYDDVDLPNGEIKISVGKGSGGHNGVQSIINALGTKDFIRIRVGVATKGWFGRVKRPKGDRLAQHVLADFKKREEHGVEAALNLASQAVQTIVQDGPEAAMNQYN